MTATVVGTPVVPAPAGPFPFLAPSRLRVNDLIVWPLMPWDCAPADRSGLALAVDGECHRPECRMAVRVEIAHNGARYCGQDHATLSI